MITYSIINTANATEHINKYLPKELMVTKIIENTIYFRVYLREYKHTFKRKELMKSNTYHGIALLIIDAISDYWKNITYKLLIHYVIERK